MTTTMIRKTSYSEVDTFLRCGRMHYYSYGLRLRGKFNGEALERGIIGHEALASYYRGRMDGLSHDDAVGEAFVTLGKAGSESEAYDKTKLNFATADLVSLYLDHYANDPIEVLAVETEFSIKILDDYELPVRVDLIVRNLHTGRVEAWDHKFVKDFYDEEAVRLKPQLPLYWAGLQEAGIHVDDLLYNMVRHRGSLSNKANPSERFVRLPIPTNASRVSRTLEEHLMAGNRIAAWKSMGIEEWNAKVLRNPSACGMCSFRALCSADLDGDDTTLLREFDYAVKTPRNDKAETMS